MGKKRRIFKAYGLNIAKRGKGGFTLAEIVVVLAIVAIASAMIVSFSVSMGDLADSNAEEYDFLEDCAIVEEKLYKWIAENDISGDFPIDDLESYGETTISDLHTIKGISFEINANDLIKCTIKPADNEKSEKVLVFALRCAN